MEEELRAIEFLKNVCTDECVNKEFVVKPILNLIEKLKEENKQLKVNEEILMKTKGCLNEDNSTNCRVLESLNYGIRAYEKTLKNSIPISVIQNKIDEIETSMNKARPFDLSYIEYCEDRIAVLQELLNERK